MKHLKRSLLLIIILLICILASWFIVKKYYLLDIVIAGLEKQIKEQIKNEFIINIDNIDINFATSKVQIIGFNLWLLNQSDTVGYFKGNIQIDLNGWRNLLFDKQKQIKNLVLQEAELYFAADYPLILKSKNENTVRKVAISNASAKGKLLFEKKHKNQNGQLSTKFDINTTLNFNSSEKISIEQLIKQVTNFKLSQIHYYFQDGFYQMKLSEITFFKFNDIMLKEAIINPIYSRKVYAQKKKVATDFINISIDSIQLNDFDSRINEQLFIDKIHVHQPKIDLFKNKNFPDNQEFQAIFVDLLQELKIPLHIRIVEINNMYIKYAELENGAKQAGQLFFSETNAKITNITNVKDSLLISDKMRIEAQAKLYGAGILKTSIYYNLLSNTGQFGVKGSLSSMNMKKANAMISKVMPISINNGQLNKLHFNFSGTRLHSEGEMWFEYSDLNMEVLELNDWNNNFTRKVVSSLGNRILRNSNPSGNGTFRVGAIDQERDTTKSMFNYWWISLRSGLLSSLGVNEEKQLINYKSGKTATLIDKIGLGEK
jgi:hypothetical protein